MNQYNRLNDKARDAYSEPTYQIFAFETSDLMQQSSGDNDDNGGYQDGEIGFGGEGDATSLI